jgi:regulator of RNase E activity RraA
LWRKPIWDDLAVETREQMTGGCQDVISKHMEGIVIKALLREIARLDRKRLGVKSRGSRMYF